MLELLQPPQQQQTPSQSPSVVSSTPTQSVSASVPLQPPPPPPHALLNGPPPSALDPISSLPVQLTPVVEQLSHSSLPPPPVFSVATIVAPPVPSAPPQEMKILDEDPGKVRCKFFTYQTCITNNSKLKTN